MEKQFDACIRAIIRYVTLIIGILQTPHTPWGEACYNKAIACREEFNSGFTNFNSTHEADCFVK